MNILVAGSTGVVGAPLTKKLVELGHQVTGTTRSESRLAGIEAVGATPTVCDALDRASVGAMMESVRPEVVINQLTNFPTDLDQRDPGFYDGTNEIRRVGGRNLLEAAQDAGVRRFVTQSLAFMYRPSGDWVKDESAPNVDEFSGSIGGAFQAMLEHEKLVVDADGIEGVILRYGFFYGPGTFYAGDGITGIEVKRRRYPIIGKGTGVMSFVHWEDAADAALAAIDHGAPGIYNVVDNEPAPMSEWVPIYAESLGAKPPRRIPLWLARLVAGKEIAALAVEMRGADNTKAKSELAWEPEHPSWRRGFLDAN